ncbi:MAG: glycosyltransferase family 39 protein [bacterium]|nr:glycosyltransferase family 39 protein [bacterium]
MHLLKRYKAEIIFFTLASVLFFASRFFNISSLPLFTDEAIYTRWSQIARYDAAWRFISLTDGKQPMFVWLDMNLMRFITDPLLAGRIISVFAGFGSMIGLYFLGREIFKNKWVGILSSTLYLIYPFALVYNRMALYDALVGMFAIWTFYFEVLLIRYIRFDIALILGMILGGGVLTKTSGFFGIYLLPFSVILFDLKKKDKLSRFLKWVLFAIVAVVFTYGYYSMLRLSPFFHIINDKNEIFIYSFSEWIKHPFEFFVGNFLGLWDWFLKYTTWPVIFLFAFSLFVYRAFTREKLLLLIWFAVPFFALALFGKILYPRFILFMTLPLLPLAALSLYKLNEFIKNKLLFTFCFFLFAFLMLRSDYFILTDFARAPIPFSDLEQYSNGWPAGGGVKEIIAFLNQESSKGKIYVASEGTFGSLPTYSVEIYLGNNKNIDKRGIWPLPAEIPSDLKEKAKKMPVYFIFNDSPAPPKRWNIKFISKYQKGIGNSFMSLYQIENK